LKNVEKRGKMRKNAEKREKLQKNAEKQANVNIMKGQ
jgi:hypothetical protein